MVANGFQGRVAKWVRHCFGEAVAYDRSERACRFLEEALELFQASGCTIDDAQQLVEYTFSRPVGEVPQEVGGVALTLSALCQAHEIDLEISAEEELARVWGKTGEIRKKNASKPHNSPLPGVGS